MNKYLIGLLTCILSLNLQGKNNPQLAAAIESADLTTFNTLFTNNQASVHDTIGNEYYNQPILYYAVGSYLKDQTLANKDIKKMIEYLLKKGAPIQNVNDQGWSALHRAVYSFVIPGFERAGKMKELEELIALLLHYGADINAQDYDGDTPLHLATADDLFSRQIVELLLENGAKIDIKNNRGLTAYEQIKDYKKRISLFDLFNAHLHKKASFTKIHQAEKDKPKKSLKDFSVHFK